jgi:DNA repair protein RecO (recombination protein O)
LDTRFFKTNAIVLNSVQFGEGHKIINLYTEDFGRVEASAFGARKSKSKFGSKLELFTVSHFLLYRKSEESIFTIKEVDVHHHNPSISEDYQKYIIGNSIIEPVILFVDKSLVDKKLYQLLSNGLVQLNEIGIEKGIHLLSMYDLQFLSIMGYSPEITLCKRCGRKIGELSFLDQNYGFPICKLCQTSASISVLPGTLKFIEWVEKHPINYSKRVTMEEKTKRNIRAVVEQLYVHTFHKKPRSWDQLNLYSNNL